MRKDKSEYGKINNGEVDDKQCSKRRKYIVLIFILVFLLSSTFFYLSKKGVVDLVEDYLHIGLDDNLSDLEEGNKDDIQKELNKKVEEGMMNVTMNTNIVLEDGKSKANLQITNKETNRYTQFVEIYTESDNKLIYKSGGIPVGKALKEAKFDVALPKGEYNCIAYFNAIDNGKIVGKVGVALKISVLN